MSAILDLVPRVRKRRYLRPPGLQDGVLRVVADHRTPEGRRVAAYMRGLLEPFIPKLLPWEADAHRNGQAKPRPPALVREMARTAGRLLLEEEQLVAELAQLAGRVRGSARTRRSRIERRLLATRGQRIKIEKLLQERAKRRM